MAKHARTFSELLVPASYGAHNSASDDPRIASWLTDRGSLEPGGVAIIGFPSDVGVSRNGGRPGAAHGPSAIRKILGRMTPDAQNPDAFVSVLERSVDLGDIPSPPPLDQGGEDDLLRMQRDLGRVVARVLSDGGVPIILGGGHETAFGHFLGTSSVFDKLSLLNWDAHADVRPVKNGLGHSGSPFRQAIELDPTRSPEYVVAGLLPQSVSTNHVAYIRAHGAAHFRSEVGLNEIPNIYSALKGNTQVSFDMDAVCGSEAPGVSAPSVDGFSAEEWMKIAFCAGESSRVVSVDIVELNPYFDIDNRTARLAALTLWQFVRGLACRGSE
jgi:formiminoglutamase